jgi:hypothetical protein
VGGAEPDGVRASVFIRRDTRPCRDSRTDCVRPQATHIAGGAERGRGGVFGPRSERSQRLLDQMELQVEEIAAGLGEEMT